MMIALMMIAPVPAKTRQKVPTRSATSLLDGGNVITGSPLATSSAREPEKQSTMRPVALAADSNCKRPAPAGCPLSPVTINCAAVVHKLAFIGFGVVGRGLTDLLLERTAFLRDRYGLEFVIVAVSDRAHGSIYDSSGLDASCLLKLADAGESLEAYPGGTKGWDSLQTIRHSNADTVVEVTFTNVQTAEPARSHCRTAFESGKHVVTTNKGPVALAWRELTQLAASKGRQFKFEGTVMSGTPVLSSAMTGLAGCTIRSVRGILNGTTNFILSQMEASLPFDEARKTAQQRGYAEADPTTDVEGWDVLAKVLILGNVLMDGDLVPADIRRQGIGRLTPADIRTASDRGCRWKLIGEVERVEGDLHGSVGPQQLPQSDPLASVSGATNAITLDTDAVGPVTIIGAGAGRRQTGFALLSDLIQIHQSGTSSP